MSGLALIFDCETSGLRRDHLPDDDINQPHVVELAAQVWRGPTMVNFMSTLIRPDGWLIEPGATAVHHITNEMAQEDGIDIRKALLPFQDFALMSDVIVAHNVQFDRAMIQGELDRLGAAGKWWNRADKFRCTMSAATDAVGIPRPEGRSGFKFPKLEEAYAHFFPSDGWQSNHRAWGDCTACARIWRALIDKGIAK